MSGVTAAAGNGIDLKGNHTLNLIGSEKVKGMMPDLSGNAMFVRMSDAGMIQTKILLTEGDFAVLDKDGTDGTARFRLSYPLPAGNTTGCYEVWARAQSPKGSANMYACDYDTAALTEICYYPTDAIVTLWRTGKGAGKFTGITRQLTYINATTPIFGEALHEYSWYYDNSGLKHPQLRVYPTAECAQLSAPGL